MQQTFARLNDACYALATGRRIAYNVRFVFLSSFFSLQWARLTLMDMSKHIGIAFHSECHEKKYCKRQPKVIRLRYVEANWHLHLLIILSMVGFCVSDCPDGWKSHKDFCFRMTDDRSETFNFAESLCRKLHPSAHLASIHNEEENEVAWIATRNITAWIGLQLVKDKWRWSDRTYFDYANWVDEKVPVSNTTGCVQLTMSKKWQNGISCKKDKKAEEGAGIQEKITSKIQVKQKRPKRSGYSSIHQNIRKRRAAKKKGKKKEGGKGKGQPALCKVPHMETCGGPDWIRAGEFCYNFSTPGQVKTWNDAGSYCLQMDARFVAIFNARQNDVLRRLARLAGSTIWLGLIHTDDGFHRWADGAIMSYENFGKHDKYDPNHKCVYLEDETGTWLHEQCEKELDFVCMRPKLQLYDSRTANNSRPRATVEIWRRIEEALVPARGPPRPSTTTTTTAKPTPELRSEMREEVIEASEKITAGVMTDTGKKHGARSRRAAGRLKRLAKKVLGHVT
ncbi:macrophage mannose receptor 1-like [Amphibalanus amphitrite]|uniref:macrophage mannose receptor 1-like n=1 Tax=Amphibalanus amphitrite TaxID=1232801 RepID=UPI001C9139FB|nr:macrophage mannose receptor 1-like [Amphibalanus amphitrite]